MESNTHAGHATDLHARHAHRRARLQVADVVETRGDRVAGRLAQHGQLAARQLRGEERQRREAQQHEQARTDFQTAFILHDRILRSIA